jgi:hypothetical protein
VNVELDLCNRQDPSAQKCGKNHWDDDQSSQEQLSAKHCKPLRWFRGNRWLILDEILAQASTPPSEAVSTRCLKIAKEDQPVKKNKGPANEPGASISDLKKAFRKTEDSEDESDQLVGAQNDSANPRKDRFWTDQIGAVARELSRLAIACDIEMFAPGVAERILKNDESVCRRTNPDAFRKIRQHLMALFPLEQAAIERLGPDETQGILDQVRAALVALRSGGSAADT